MYARDYFPGVGQAVADRTVNRPGEAWGDVARRVALGNTALVPMCQDREPLERAIAAGQMLLSGRHLQHGDAEQPNRNMEVFTNCSTGSQRAVNFYLLLNGSGVGTSYDDDMCIVDWRYMPKIHIVLSSHHRDYDGRWEPSLAGALVRAERDPVIFTVPDSREGWAEAVMQIEDMTWAKDQRDLILDFSEVRPKGSPIGGMQSRPSSGPIPLMEAIVRAQEMIRGQRIPLWEQAMILDHLFAEIVLVGGARRAARIAVKWWGDEDIIAFVNIKQTGGLWTANNSVGVDSDFWKMVAFYKQYGYAPTSHHQKAWDVYQAVTQAQYRHGTGEPAFLNMDMLSKGERAPTEGEALQLSGRMQLTETSIELRRQLMKQAAVKKYCVIVNPCGEIRLSVNGGYCVIGDIALAHCETQEEFDNAARLMTRALIRTNTMPALYQGEVSRTNRIGVALTGIFEYAWTRFGLTFHDLVAEGHEMIVDANGNPMPGVTKKAEVFWLSLMQAAMIVEEECQSYSTVLGVEPPVTSRTIKPAGTTSKLFGLTEGAHLPAMAVYLRWVQFREDDSLIAEYEAKGYPVRRDLKSYKNVVIIGFPTCLPIGADMGDKLVTATDATFAQQIRWIRLLETYWLLRDGGNQVSYTLKYDPKVVDEEEYQALVLEHVPNVRAVSVMPQTDDIQYEYQPEEAISMDRYRELVATIELAEREDVGQEHVDSCATGACPISFDNRSLSKVVSDGAMG